MDRITLQNYRCFGSEEQSARLAPLTLLVGPNSTGKTSFLALIRALWDVAFREVVPNFREEPYDLGSWDDIVYRPMGRSEKAHRFVGGFIHRPKLDRYIDDLGFVAGFSDIEATPFPTERTYEGGGGSVHMSAKSRTEGDQALYRTEEGDWNDVSENFRTYYPNTEQFSLYLLQRLPTYVFGSNDEKLANLSVAVESVNWREHRPFANAPTRSRPRRTYDPILLAQDAEGDYVPSYLANLSRRNADEWQLFKRQLEEFGNVSQLFDEIQVRSFGRSDGDPFQIQVRKHSGPKSRRRKGPWRNLIDVGYGVSQTLPVLTELLRPDGPTMSLLQQPEVHLHPQAQAALGTLFCQVAAGGRQLVIETHSDYIIDRVRMDVRDGTTGLKPKDVSILYFEPGDAAVKIHSITIDDYGNLDGAPTGYRQFFSDELTRSIGL